MKLPTIQNCTLLASTLSANYRSYEPHTPQSSSLEQHLDRHGILLTMCMRFGGLVPGLECSVRHPDQPQHIASSWIQQNITGFRVVSPPVDLGPPVGLVLKPTATEIRCTYPVDAGTLSRLNNGCGPFANDYNHASWYKKLLMREEVTSYKNSVFGRNRTWESIPCSEFMTPNATNSTPNVDAQVVGFLNDDSNGESSSAWSYYSLSQYTIDQWSLIMGHDVCNRTSPAPQPILNDTSHCLVYGGSEFWQPNEWEDSLQLLRTTLKNHTKLGTWNELVLNVEHFDDSIQAVFYVNGGDKELAAKRIATREAKRLGKPLLFVDPNEANQMDLFHCPKQRQQLVSVSKTGLRRSAIVLEESSTMSAS